MSSYPTDLADQENEDEEENEDELEEHQDEEQDEENEEAESPFLLALFTALATIPSAPHMQACTFAI